MIDYFRRLTTLDRVGRTLQQAMLRPTLMLLTFNIAAQLISLCVSPLLTRLYAPEQFGILGVITAIVMTSVPLAGGRFELGVPSAPSDAAAYTLLRVCFIAILLGSTIAALLTYLTTYLVPSRVSFLLTGHWILVPIGIASVALYDVLALEASRQNQLQSLARSKISQSLAGVGGQLIFGYLGWTSIGLLLGFVLNQLMGVGSLYRKLVSNHPARGAVSIRQIARSAYENRRYPLFTSWPQALHTGSRWSLQFALALLWDPKIAGFVFLADRVVGRPLQLLSSSLLPVYVADLSRVFREAPSEALPTFYRTLLRQLPLTVVWTLAVIILAPWVIGPLFGKAWLEAVPFMQVIALAIAPASLLNSVVHTMQMTGHQRFDAVLSVASVSLTIAVIVVGRHLHASALATLIAYTLGQIIFAVAALGSYWHVLKTTRPPTLATTA